MQILSKKLPASFKIRKRFVDSDRREYNKGDYIDLDNRMKIDRMIYYGIIERIPLKKRKKTQLNI